MKKSQILESFARKWNTLEQSELAVTHNAMRSRVGIQATAGPSVRELLRSFLAPTSLRLRRSLK